MIGNRSNNTSIVKEPVTLETTAAVLLRPWHSLITRINFNLFCRFDELSIPDYSTLCRYRNWLAQDNTLSELLEMIHRQLTEGTTVYADIRQCGKPATSGSTSAAGRHYAQSPPQLIFVEDPLCDRTELRDAAP